MIIKGLHMRSRSIYIYMAYFKTEIMAHQQKRVKIMEIMEFNLEKTTDNICSMNLILRCSNT